MKQIHYNFFGYLILIIFLNLPLLAEARNYDYEGHEILFDQPEGEIKFYNAKVEVAVFYKEKLDSEDIEFIIPVIKGNDGKVYIKNLFGTLDGDAGFFPVWMVGFEEKENFIFDLNSIYGFSFLNVFYPDTFLGSPLIRLEYGKVNQDNSIEILDSNNKIILQKENEGYSINISEGEGLITNNYFISSFECKLSENTYVFPPQGYEAENYQINFQPASSLYYKGSASLPLKVVKTPNEIYIQGMSAIGPGNPEAWIKGTIVGNKILFPNAQLMNVGRNGENMYLTPMYVATDWMDPNIPHTRHSHTIIECIPTNKDLIFDYDEKTGKIYNPNSALGFTSIPNQTFYFNISSFDDTFVEQTDFFSDMEFIKVPDNIELEPLPMDKNKVNYLAKNGYMMNPDDLYVVFYDAITNNPIEIEYLNCNTWNYERGYLYNFGTVYFSNRYRLDSTWVNLTNEQYIFTYFLNLPKDYYAVLYYLPDGKEIEFQPGGNSAISKIIDAYDYNKNSFIYDLSGRKYDNILNLQPGLYIINGKKTLIK